VGDRCGDTILQHCAKEVQWFSRQAHQIFGTPLTTIRFYVVTTSLSIITSYLALGLAVYVRHPVPTETGITRVIAALAAPVVVFTSDYKPDIQAVYGVAIGNIIGDLLGTILMLSLLRKMAATTTPGKLTRSFLIDIVVGVASVFLVFVTTAMTHTIGPTNEAGETLKIIGELLDEVFVWNSTGFAIFLSALPAVVPTVLHLTVLSGVLLTKWATPIIRSPVLLVLERLAEAEKGTILILAAGLAGCTKRLDLGLNALAK
jgi:hypothetical protein